MARATGQLAGRLGRDCATAFAASLGAVLVIGVVRFWPRIAGPGMPSALIWPFARPLAAAALESAFLVGIPIGICLAVGAMGSFRLSRWPETATIVASVLAAAGLSFGTSAWLDPESDSPGQLARDLVQRGLASCQDERPARVEVPMLGVTWVCEGSAPPRVEGKAPMGKSARFSAAELTLSDDLRQLSLKNLVLNMKLASGPPGLVIRARSASITGLPPWGRPRKLSVWHRGLLFAGSVLCSALAAAWLIERRRLGRLAAGALGVAAALSMWWLSVELDRRPGGALYFLMPVVGIGAMLGFWALSRALSAVLRRIQKA